MQIGVAQRQKTNYKTMQNDTCFTNFANVISEIHKSKPHFMNNSELWCNQLSYENILRIVP